ncbi:Splicing factor PWI [Penicillium camemberti]|uniref:Splicing factor PWI n=1 Tax=Penicillium camemberti (strain FM 013) TaxID=1429867 RepID=A0A0G4P1V8_PENC3|nr:Splicing factor PWI [Penicillium camemberti]
MASSVDSKLIRRTKFPPEFNKKVDMTKVNIEVMKKWIASQISKVLGNEDDVVIELCFAHLERSRYPDIKSLQIQLTGFLDKDTPKFCQELWSLCLSGQANPQGVPKELLEAKKLELIQEKVILEAEKASEALRRQREQDQNRERELDDVRRRERTDRGPDRGRGGRGGDRGDRGGRGGRGRDFNNRRFSPPRDQDRSRDRFREPLPRRDFDSYVPPGNRRGRRPSKSSHGTRSPSRSPKPSSPSRRNRDEPRHRRRDRRPRSPGNSVSPERRNRGGARRRSSPDYGDRVKARPISRSRSPRSRSPRGDRRRRSSVSRSRSVSSQPRHTRRRAESPKSVSPSRSHRSSGRYARRDSRRLSRSRSRSPDRTGTRDRGENRRRRSPSGGRSRSRSRSPKKDTDGKRRRSLERYNPDEKRRKVADENDDSTRPPLKADDPSKADDHKADDHKADDNKADDNKADDTKADNSETKVAEQTKKPLFAWIHSTAFREKLLREKCIAMRRRSSENPSSASQPKQD